LPGLGCSRWPVVHRQEATAQTEAEASREHATTSAQARAAEEPAPPASGSDTTVLPGPASGVPAAARAKIESLQAWQRGRGDVPPADLARSAQDLNPLVRAAAVEAAAARRVPEAEKMAASALEDPDLQVRLAAVAALGALGGDKATASLQSLLDDRGEVVRAAAVRALAREADDAILVRAWKDRSWRVRLAAAEALATRPDATGAQLARELLDDPSAAVQAAVVHSVERWPRAQAGPVLLAALASNARSTREAAARQLAAAWPDAAEFAIDGSPSQRAEALARLHAAFRNRFPSDLGTPAKAVQEKPPAPRPSAEQVAEARRLIQAIEAPGISTRVREESFRRLAGFGASLVGILECMTAESRSPLPEAVYRDVLPQCAPEFAAMVRLGSADVSARRRAAEELAALGQRQALGPLARSRLAAVAEKEPDALVWRGTLGAIAHDASEPSLRLACAAASHPAPEVRRLACEYLLRHPEAKQEPVLLAALNDPHREVVCAAVRALGARGALEDRQPLKRLLGTADESMRVEAALALARLGDPAGPAALERLAQSTDPVVRRQAATAMGQVPNPAYKATLIRLLDDRYSIRLAALESLSKVAGGETSRTPDAERGTIEERIARWKHELGGTP